MSETEVSENQTNMADITFPSDLNTSTSSLMTFSFRSINSFITVNRINVIHGRFCKPQTSL